MRQLSTFLSVLLFVQPAAAQLRAVVPVTGRVGAPVLPALPLRAPAPGLAPLSLPAPTLNGPLAAPALPTPTPAASATARPAAPAAAASASLAAPVAAQAVLAQTAAAADELAKAPSPGSAKAEAGVHFDLGRRGTGDVLAGVAGFVGSGLSAPSLSRGPANAAVAAPAAASDRPFLFRHYRLARLLVRPLVRVFYRTRVTGLENLPPGPALILPNHISYVDAIVLSFAADRPMRFMMLTSIYETKGLKWLFKALGAMPISPNDGPQKVEAALERARAALRDGQTVVIFPEGQLTRDGNMVGFRGGFSRIAQGVPDVPVVPAYLDGLWGSVFSMQKGPSFWSRLKELPRPVEALFGTALTKAEPLEARLAVSELGAQAMERRVRSRRAPLAREFAAAAKKHWNRPAIADSTGQDLSYGRALTGAVLLGGVLDAELSGEKNVAVLMPPSAGGALANLALAAAGRTAVNLNYTASRDALTHAVLQAELKTVVTSKRFLEALKADRGFEPPAGLRLVFLEDLAPRIPSWKKTLTYLVLRVLPTSLVRRWFMPKAVTDLDATATVLFTSGSSALPKGVELSQLNVLANVEMVREVFPWAPRDVVLGVLPFFHSFGYTVTLWLALLSGMGAAYHVHPMQAEEIGKLALKVKPTILLGTPAFLQRYAQRIAAEAFASLRLVIAGAEKLRDSVADEFQSKFGVRPYEGYGATELSPVATAALPDAGRQKGSLPGSVGRALPGSAIKVVDPATGDLVPYGAPGMLLVKGPHVMRGYLGEPGKTAEVLQDGWYVTGDIATLDRDGFVSIVGRLSRFSKIAGEMVSHVAVEEKLQAAAALSEMTFVVTGVKDEKRGERLVVLYAGWAGDVPGLLAKARAAGVPNIWLPAAGDFYKVEALPLLGTGKLDLKAVNELAGRLAGRPF
jgi:acyl-[acyl-carrier-protein]-phospholipid O-acyltransferase/long-chain-fatty-acid--[acyl-carrier-protein] ligase